MGGWVGSRRTYTWWAATSRVLIRVAVAVHNAHTNINVPFRTSIAAFAERSWAKVGKAWIVAILMRRVQEERVGGWVSGSRKRPSSTSSL